MGTDLQHKLFLLTLDGKLHFAPFEGEIYNVLDIGTGTGIWAIDFGTFCGNVKASLD
jgi:methylase of polypeptide subunit release factors